MSTYGLDSFNCNISKPSCASRPNAVDSTPHLHTRRFSQKLRRSCSFLLEGPDHFQGNTTHASTDLHRTSCHPLRLVRLQRLMRPSCVAFFRLQKAILAQIFGVLLILLLVRHQRKRKVLVRAIWPTATVTTKEPHQASSSSAGLDHTVYTAFCHCYVVI